MGDAVIHIAVQPHGCDKHDYRKFLAYKYGPFIQAMPALNARNGYSCLICCAPPTKAKAKTTLCSSCRREIEYSLLLPQLLDCYCWNHLNQHGADSLKPEEFLAQKEVIEHLSKKTLKNIKNKFIRVARLMLEISGNSPTTIALVNEYLNSAVPAHVTTFNLFERLHNATQIHPNNRTLLVLASPLTKLERSTAMEKTVYIAKCAIVHGNLTERPATRHNIDVAVRQQLRKFKGKVKARDIVQAVYFLLGDEELNGFQSPPMRYFFKDDRHIGNGPGCVIMQHGSSASKLPTENKALKCANCFSDDETLVAILDSFLASKDFDEIFNIGGRLDESNARDVFTLLTATEIDGQQLSAAALFADFSSRLEQDFDLSGTSFVGCIKLAVYGKNVESNPVLRRLKEIVDAWLVEDLSALGVSLGDQHEPMRDFVFHAVVGPEVSPRDIHIAALLRTTLLAHLSKIYGSKYEKGASLTGSMMKIHFNYYSGVWNVGATPVKSLDRSLYEKLETCLQMLRQNIKYQEDMCKEPLLRISIRFPKLDLYWYRKARYHPEEDITVYHLVTNCTFWIAKHVNAHDSTQLYQRVAHVITNMIGDGVTESDVWLSFYTKGNFIYVVVLPDVNTIIYGKKQVRSRILEWTRNLRTQESYRAAVIEELKKQRIAATFQDTDNDYESGFPLTLEPSSSMWQRIKKKLTTSWPRAEVAPQPQPQPQPQPLPEPPNEYYDRSAAAGWTDIR